MEPTTPPALADHLVEEVFIRVGDPADLARTSATCKAFYRLITDPIFLRRYHALHPPLLLGFVDPVPDVTTGLSFIPVDADHPNAPAARALAGSAADFSFSDLPHREGDPAWYPRDTRHGLVLLECYADTRPFGPDELTVYDPLVPRNTLVLPPIPDSLLDSAPLLNSDERRNICFRAFFDPSVSYNEVSQFRVMAWCPSRCAIFIYSSVSNAWTLGASVAADLLGPKDFPEQDLDPSFASYVNGCVYWTLEGTDKLIKLNVSSMELSVICLPPDREDILWCKDSIVVEDREGTMLICHLGVAKGDRLRLYITQIREDDNNKEEEDEYYPVHTPIPLPEYERYDIDSVSPGYIFIRGYRQGYKRISVFFALEIKTMKLERVLSLNGIEGRFIPYFGHPLFMSAGRI